MQTESFSRPVNSSAPLEDTNKVNGQLILLITRGLTMAYRKVGKVVYTLMRITTRTARYAG